MPAELRMGPIIVSEATGLVLVVLWKVDRHVVPELPRPHLFGQEPALERAVGPTRQIARNPKFTVTASRRPT